MRHLYNLGRFKDVEYGVFILFFGENKLKIIYSKSQIKIYQFID